MKNFLFESIVNELNQEILFITYNYQSEFLTVDEIKKFTASDYDNLNKSKSLLKIGELIEDFIVANSVYSFDYEIIDIIKKREYDYENLSKIMNYINPIIKDYYKHFKELENKLKDILNIKYDSKTYKGEYPVYLSLTESNCKIERVTINTNAKSILYKESTKFAFKIVYMEYDVPIKDYKFKGSDLRDMTKDQIFKTLDSSIKINLNNAKYYDSTPIFFNKDGDDYLVPDYESIALKLEHRNMSYGGLKTALKDSLKRTGFTMLVLISITLLILLIKYLRL